MQAVLSVIWGSHRPYSLYGYALFKLQRDSGALKCTYSFSYRTDQQRFHQVLQIGQARAGSFMQSPEMLRWQDGSLESETNVIFHERFMYAIVVKTGRQKSKVHS